ncbi:MAG: amino acid permease [Oceanicoccus sp.]|uniref:APC family permease n=1 Tax=Oceanicoccus sp. TaxID=2691044 RepID=UPI0026134E02|nr:amino acid permease [Oceanicoccus sp.]MCP3908825.1 amino acid permease [Oceanicoccus sp.]
MLLSPETIDPVPEPEGLARRINLPLLIFYGLGTILGAGIYVLVGKVAGSAGMLAPLAFIVAGVIAWLTAMSYSKLAVLFPQSAGEAIYIEHGFQQQWLSMAVGLLIILTGIVSAATLTRGFIGYFVLLVPVNETFAMVAALVLLTALAAWGIAESLTMAALVTLIEIAGLVIVLVFCGDSLQQLPVKAPDLLIPSSAAQVAGIFSGAFLAFYAFIGFEDMVNVVEEVKQPETTMPKAIFWVVVISTGLYVLIALVATLSLPLNELAQSKAPLAELLSSKNAVAAKVVAVISVLAIVNGVLIQIIMASRVCYGLSKRFGGPHYLHRVSSITKTPVIATLLIAALILVAALSFPLTALAKFTSFIILIIFSLINFALWKMHRNHYQAIDPVAVQQISRLRSYPLLAGSLCLALLLFQVSY